MEKKICEICANEFECEDLEETLCENCKKEVEKEIEKIENPEAVIEEEALETEEIAKEATEVSLETEEDGYEADDDMTDAQMSADVILSANGEELTDEEILAIEEAERAKQEKKKKIVLISSIVAGVVALILVALFVPFKNDSMLEGKKVNLYTAIEEAITFNNDKTAAMSISGVRIDESLFKYFMESAQYSVMMENLGAQPTQDDIKNFWSREIDGKSVIEIAKENAVKDVISLIVLSNKAAENGIEAAEEEKNAIEYQLNSVTDDMLKQVGITRNQFKYLLEKSALSNAYSKKIITEDARYQIADEKVAESIKAKGEKISAKHILFNTIDMTTYQPLDEAKMAEVKKKAEETLAKINSGEDFDTLMNELSEDPGLSMYPDGYTFSKGEMVEPFEKAAFELEEGKVSGLVTTDFGIHIIKRIPLHLYEQDYAKEKSLMQQAIFENDIINMAKGEKIIYNKKLIDEMAVVKAE